MRIKNKKGEYTFQKFVKGKVITKTKLEENLTHSEVELLYQNFAAHWDDLPIKVKNKFMAWLRKSLEERYSKSIKNEIN